MGIMAGRRIKLQKQKKLALKEKKTEEEVPEKVVPPKKKGKW